MVKPPLVAVPVCHNPSPNLSALAHNGKPVTVAMRNVPKLDRIGPSDSALRIAHPAPPIITAKNTSHARQIPVIVARTRHTPIRSSIVGTGGLAFDFGVDPGKYVIEPGVKPAEFVNIVVKSRLAGFEGTNAPSHL